MTKQKSKIFLDFIKNICYNKGTKTKGNKPQKGIDTMFEITYRNLEDGFYSKGIFFSEEEWEAFEEDSAEAGGPVIMSNCVKIDPMIWYHKVRAAGGYEWPYVVEIMGYAIMGQKWASQFDKWADMEKALKELGII